MNLWKSVWLYFRCKTSGLNNSNPPFLKICVQVARNNFSHNLGCFCHPSINSFTAFAVLCRATREQLQAQREWKWFSIISRNISQQMLRQFAFHFSNCSDEHFRTEARALITNENQQIHFNRSFPEIFFPLCSLSGFLSGFRRLKIIKAEVET